MSEVTDCIAFIVRKTCWSLAKFLEFLFKRILDLLGLVFNLAACCTILRLPAMILEFRDMKSWWTWRFIGFVQLCIFIMDLPIIVMALFILVTMLRLYPLVKDMKKEKPFDEFRHNKVHFSGMKIRGIIVKHFFILFIDLFCLVFFVVCLLSWRSVIFCRKMNKEKSWWQRRKILFIEFLQVLWDIPLLLCFLFGFFSWRLPFVYIELTRRVKEKERWDDIRYIGISQILLLIIDIPCLIGFLVTLFSWRSPILIWSLIGLNLFEEKDQREIRIIMITQFLYLFVDIPCILAGLLVLLTVWRFPILLRAIKKEFLEKSTMSRDRKRMFYRKEFRIRRICVFEFSMVLVDFVAFFLALVVIFSLWRIYPLLEDIKKYLKKYNEQKNGNKKQLDLSGADERGNMMLESNNPVNVGKQDFIDIDSDEKIDAISETLVEKDVTLKDVRFGAELQGDIEKNDNELVMVVNPDSKDAKKYFKWSSCMWKIRKAILIHFAFLFADVPAMPLFIFLLVTVLRASKTISGLAGGKFYMVFAATIYYQTFRFFVDLFFIFLFLILMILRPVNSWVFLLEDEEHKEYRLVKELIVWTPDICKDSAVIHTEMEEILDFHIKQKSGKRETSEDIRQIMCSHLARIDELIDKLISYDIDGEFCFLLKNIRYFEEKRVGKLMRKYQVECCYMERADNELHNKNIGKWNREASVYEENVAMAYGSLLHYTPEKVPLYARQCGLKLRSRRETRQVLIDCLPRGNLVVAIVAFVCIIFLYRAPKMIMAIRKKFYDRYNIVITTLKQYGYDVLTFVRITMVLLFIYRAPALIADILDCLIEKRSWNSVRNVVKNYPPTIFEDLKHMLLKVCSWKTPRYIFTNILFGILMPAELFLSFAKLIIENNIIAYLTTLFLYVVFVVSPFVFTLYGAGKLSILGMGWVNITVTCIFVLSLLIIIMIMILCLAKHKKGKILLAMPECDYIRLNWYNIHVIIFEVLEFFQSLAIVFRFPNLPMYGSNVIKVASTYLLFSFMSYETMFYITATAFTVWFFLCGVPVIQEKVLASSPVGTISSRASWRLGISLFGNTLFVTMLESMISSLACKYENCPLTASSISINDTSHNMTTSCLVDGGGLPCWTGSHLGYASFALFSIVWYSSTSFIFGTQYGDPETSKLDIGFSPIYNYVINIFKGGMIIIATVVTNNDYVVLAFLLTGFLLCFTYTASFHSLFGCEPCNLRTVLVWRCCTFISCIFASISVVVAFAFNDPSSLLPLLVFLAGTFITCCVSLIVTLKLLSLSAIEKDRQSFCDEIISLESRLVKNKWMHQQWNGERKMWLRLVGSVRVARKDDKFLTTTTFSQISDPVTNSTVEVSSHQQNIELPGDHVSTSIAVPEEISGTLVKDGSPPASIPPLQEVSHSEITPQETDLSLYSMTLPHPPAYTVGDSSVQNRAVDDISQCNISDSIMQLKKNGVNLLLILEKYVHYTAYSYSSLSQRDFWISNIFMSNWPGLLNGVRILSGNLNGTFEKPTLLDKSLSKPSLVEDVLAEDNQDSVSPPLPFIRKSKEEISLESEKLRKEAIETFGDLPIYGDKWRALLDKILPTGPILKSWMYTANDGKFEFIFRRVNSGVVVDFETPGLKLALGASLTIGKKMRGHLDENRLTFDDGFGIVGKKGPLAITVKYVSFIERKNSVYLEVNGKQIKYHVAVASAKSIKWR